jgi:hypothetical protein
MNLGTNEEQCINFNYPIQQNFHMKGTHNITPLISHSKLQTSVFTIGHPCTLVDQCLMWGTYSGVPN